MILSFSQVIYVRKKQTLKEREKEWKLCGQLYNEISDQVIFLFLFLLGSLRFHWNLCLQNISIFFFFFQFSLNFEKIRFYIWILSLKFIYLFYDYYFLFLKIKFMCKIEFFSKFKEKNEFHAKFRDENNSLSFFVL